MIIYVFKYKEMKKKQLEVSRMILLELEKKNEIFLGKCDTG